MKIYKDGDEQVRVRMIGIDTPESVHPTESKNTKWNGKHKEVFFKTQVWAMNHEKGFWKDGYDVAFPG